VRGKWSPSHTDLFAFGEIAPVPIGQETGWAPEPVWTTWRREKSRPYRDPNSDSSAVQPVVSRYTDCAIYIFIYLYRIMLFIFMHIYLFIYLFLYVANRLIALQWNIAHPKHNFARCTIDCCQREEMYLFSTASRHVLRPIPYSIWWYRGSFPREGTKYGDYLSTATTLPFLGIEMFNPFHATSQLYRLTILVLNYHSRKNRIGINHLVQHFCQ
jgi:hypothetical protein